MPHQYNELAKWIAGFIIGIGSIFGAVYWFIHVLRTEKRLSTNNDKEIAELKVDLAEVNKIVKKLSELVSVMHTYNQKEEVEKMHIKKSIDEIRIELAKLYEHLIGYLKNH